MRGIRGIRRVGQSRERGGNERVDRSGYHVTVVPANFEAEDEE